MSSRGVGEGSGEDRPPATTSSSSGQYTALRFTDRWLRKSIAASIGTIGDAYANCVMQSIDDGATPETLHGALMPRWPTAATRCHQLMRRSSHASAVSGSVAW